MKDKKSSRLSFANRLFSRIRKYFEKPLHPRTIYLNSSCDDRKSYPTNYVKNQKYSVFLFLPMFKHFFNILFLTIILLQLVPEVNSGSFLPAAAPLFFAVTVTVLRECYDEFKRFKRDKQVNSQIYERLREDGSVEQVTSGSIKVGDIIIVTKNTRVPADLLLLQVPDSSGSMFIKTDQLDGETDWKLRIAPLFTQRISREALFDHNISIYADKPCKNIYEFIGTLSYEENGKSMKESLCLENTVWMNTVAAFSTLIGCVMYTGKDSRFVMNTSKAKIKFGAIDSELDFLSVVLCIMTLALSIIMVALKGFNGPWGFYFLKFFFLLIHFIPIGLRVNLDVEKIVNSWFISRDKEMNGIIVRTTTIPEELGRIQFLLTDKTGTLTKNEMNFKKIHIGNASFSLEQKEAVKMQISAFLKENSVLTMAKDSSRTVEIGQQLEKIQTEKSKTIDFSDILPSRSSSMRRNQSGQLNRSSSLRKIETSSRIVYAIFALAVCHNVTPVEENNEVSYQASSPDEIALIKWSECVGVKLIERSRESLKLQLLNDSVQEFEILYIFPFTSESKRMGIVVRSKSTNEIIFFQKGADVVMAKIAQETDWLDEISMNMAMEGLRTLVLAHKILSERDFESFKNDYEAAKLSVEKRNQCMDRVVASHLERGLEILGITGVEDLLQNEVKSSLETLRNAGIKIWMLTGDKIETSICIARSSKLISKSQEIYVVKEVRKELDALVALDHIKNNIKIGLVIDGQSLQYMLDNHPKEFITNCSYLSTVACCRCSPTQKALVAQLVRTYTKKKICCIGDGGNDVSMIIEANVGVGIVGKEGMQASLASDYSLCEFRDLPKLLLYHGRNSYKRTAKISHYVIHRGVIMGVIQIVFSSIFYFAPIQLYQGMIALGWGSVYTNLSTFALLLNRDISSELALKFPELYKELTKGRLLNLKTFFSCVGISVYQGGVIMISTLWLFNDQLVYIVSITFTALILNEIIYISSEVNKWHYLIIVAELIGFLLYVISFAAFKDELEVPNNDFLSFALKVLILTTLSFAPILILRVIVRWFYPPSYLKIQRSLKGSKNFLF